MAIPKDQILSLLREQGKTGDADRAAGELPDQVDPERDGALLARLGLGPAELVAKFAGGGAGLGGLGGKLGL